MEIYTWEGFEEELYQHLKICMDHVEMGDIHNSMDELSQPPISSFGRKGDLSMDHSLFMSRNFGKEHAYVHNVSFDDYLHSFTMYMQAIALRRSILTYKIHGQLWAINISKHGHSLGGYREMFLSLWVHSKSTKHISQFQLL